LKKMPFRRFEFTFNLLEDEIKRLELFIGKRKKRRKKLFCNEKEILKDWKDALKELKNLKNEDAILKLMKKLPFPK